ncbi:MAG: class I SAM-dependent rRNA methyltransferase [Oscillospiraceae bacterium]|nr:class I SAM-dependent rRNA methyltransferase [Oscillospiraceae bacterium]
MEVFMQNYPKVTITKKAEKTVKDGFPWVYDTEVSVGENINDGGVVYVYSEKDRYLGTGFYNSASKLRVRFVTRNSNDIIDREFWKRKIRWAFDYRKQVMGDDFGCCRLIFGDSDGFPGLTVDRYDDVLCAEVLNLGIDRIKDTLFEIMTDTLKDMGETVTAVWERSTGKNRQLEGLEDSVGFRLTESLGTDVSRKEVVVNENGLKIRVDFVDGQKTGYFLDQKYNHAAAARYSRGKKVLDCCTHTGGFALNCAASGAETVLGIDISMAAVEEADRNAKMNRLVNISFEKHDVFDFLTEHAMSGDRQWDFIILDPPAFTKSRNTVKSASAGYEKINYLAMKLLPRGGYLVTCSCSRFMTPELFEKTVAKAADEAGVRLRLIEKRGASPDHPVLLGAPDTEYLKCFIYQVI